MPVSPRNMSALVAVVFALCVVEAHALSEYTINVILVATTLSVLVGAVVTCGVMYFLRGNKQQQQPPLSSMENRTASDLADDNINVNGKKKKTGKKSKKPKDKQDDVRETDIEHGQSTPLLNHTDECPHEPPAATSAGGPLSSGECVPAETPVAPASKESIPSVPLLKLPPFLFNSRNSTPVEKPSVEKDNVHDETTPSSSVAAEESPSNASSSRTSTFFKRHFNLVSSSETLKPVVVPPSPLVCSQEPSPRNSVLQDKLAKLKAKKEVTPEIDANAPATVTAPAPVPVADGIAERSADTSANLDAISSAALTASVPTPTSPKGAASVSASTGEPLLPSLSRSLSGNAQLTPRPHSPTAASKTALMNSALRNAFLMTIAEGVNVVHHSTKSPQPCKLRCVDSHLIVIERKSVLGSKKVLFKSEISALQRIEVGRSTVVLQAANKSVQDTNCMSLTFAEGSVDIECHSRKERDALVEGFRMFLPS